MLELNEGKVSLDGADIRTLKERYGTPFYLFSERTLERNYRELTSALAKNYPNFRIDYSVKSNNEIGVLKILHSLGSHGEIANHHELFLAQRAGFRPEQLTLDAPCKSRADIEECLKAGIYAFNLDSIEDLEDVNEAAKRLGKTAKVNVRVNIGLKKILPDMAEMYIGKFGVLKKDAARICELANAASNLELIGISTHMGSQITSVEPYLKLAEGMFDVAREVEARGLNISEICLGGGFPSQSLQKTSIPSFVLSGVFGISRVKEVPALREYGERISQKFAELAKTMERPPVLVLQPGRSVASSMGVLVSEVKYVKGQWVFIDASVSFLPESLFFAQRKILFPEGQAKDGAKAGRFKVSGGSLNSADIFSMDVRIPKPARGDLALVLDAGTYSISRAQRFAVVCPPVYMLDKDGKIKMIRRAENGEDLAAAMLD